MVPKWRAITLDMDADSLVHIHHGANAQNKLSAISSLRYGPEVAIPRILDTTEGLDLNRAFSYRLGTGKSSSAVDAIVKDGHEIGYHGYIHEAPNSLSHDQEHDWMCRSIEIIERHTGRRPRGNRAPLYHMSAKTPEQVGDGRFPL